jgi:hypothetical protein
MIEFISFESLIFLVLIKKKKKKKFDFLVRRLKYN